MRVSLNVEAVAAGLKGKARLALKPLPANPPGVMLGGFSFDISSETPSA